MAGNILLKGYSAAAANGLTTELNSLADGNVTALGSQIDNTSALDEFVDVQLDLASLTISSTSAYVTLFLVPAVATWLQALIMSVALAPSAAAALAGRSFRWEGFGSTEDVANHLVGGTLMGVGGVTAMGCTVGQGLSGISTLSAVSFIAVAAIMAGALWTIMIGRR